MGIAVIYTAYLTVSIGLTVVVASALSRSGRVFLVGVFGGDESMAGAVNRMLVVVFYLLSLGYVALTVRTSGQFRGPGQAIGVLSVKVGEELLVLGVLYLLNIAMFARFRRRREERGFQPPPQARDSTSSPHQAEDSTSPPPQAGDSTSPPIQRPEAIGRPARERSRARPYVDARPYIDLHGRA